MTQTDLKKKIRNQIANKNRKSLGENSESDLSNDGSSRIKPSDSADTSPHSPNMTPGWPGVSHVAPHDDTAFSHSRYSTKHTRSQSVHGSGSLSGSVRSGELLTSGTDHASPNLSQLGSEEQRDDINKAAANIKPSPPLFGPQNGSAEVGDSVKKPPMRRLSTDERIENVLEQNKYMHSDLARSSDALWDRLEPDLNDHGVPTKFVLPFDRQSGMPSTNDPEDSLNGSSDVSGRQSHGRKSTNLDSDSSSNTGNYPGSWTDPKNQRQVSNSASADLMHIDLEKPDSQGSVLDQNYSSSIPRTKLISGEILSENSKKSNSDKSSSSKASRSSGSQHQKSRSEDPNDSQSSFLSHVSQPASIDGSASENSNKRSSTDSKSKIKPNSGSISSVASADLSTSGSAASIDSQNLSQHGSKNFNEKKMEAVGQIPGTGPNSFSGSDEISGNADSFDLLVNNVAFDIGLDVTANTNNTIDHLASVVPKNPNHLSDITPKKQSTSNAHRSSSSSSKKSSSDSNEDNDSSENINNNRRLTWDELSGLRSFQNLQGVYSLQQCFANAFGYTDDLDGTTMTPDSDFVSKKFSRHLAAHCVDLANNGNISKMFEHLRKQEGDTYQAVSDKWDATRALVQGLNPAPDGNILELLWKLDGTGKHEKDLIAKLTKLNDQGAELISLIPENTTFSTLLKMYSGTKNRTIVVSDDDYVPSASTTDDSEWTSSTPSRSKSNSDSDQNSPSSKNSKKKINRDDDDPSGKSSNHGLTQQQLLADENFTNLPGKELKETFFNAFGFVSGDQSEVPSVNDILARFRSLFSKNYARYVTPQTYHLIEGLLKTLAAQSGDDYLEIYEKLVATSELMNEFKNLDPDFMSAFWMWDPDDSNPDLLGFYGVDPDAKPLELEDSWGISAVPGSSSGKLYIDFLIKIFEDLPLIIKLKKMVDSKKPDSDQEEEQQNSEERNPEEQQNSKKEAKDNTSWEALLANQDLQNLPDKLKRILLNAFGFDSQGNARKPDHPSIIQRLRNAFAKDYVEYTDDNYLNNLSAIFTIFMNKSSQYYPYAEICNKVDATDSLRNKFGELDQDFMVAFWKWKPYEDDTSLDQYYVKDQNGASLGKQYIDFLVFGDKYDDYVDDGVYSLDTYLKKIIDRRPNEGQQQQPNSEEEEEEEALTEVTWEDLSNNEHWQNLPNRLKAIFRRAFGFSENGEPKNFGSNEILKSFRSAFAANYMSYNEKYSESIDPLLVLLLSATGDTYNEINDKSCLTDELIKKFRNPDKDFMTAFWTWNVLDPNDDGKISTYYHEEDTPGKACLDFVCAELKKYNTKLEDQLNRAIGIGNAEEENANDEDVDN